MATLNDQAKPKSLKILVPGLAYKANVDDCRESHPLFFMEKLEAKEQRFSITILMYRCTPTREHAHFNGRKSVVIEDTYDLILLSTDHAEYKEFDFSNFLPFC